MNIKMTAEQIADLGKVWGNAYLSSLSVDKRLSGLKPQERLVGLSPQELDELQDYFKKREQKN